jgi:hypothetical protein
MPLLIGIAGRRGHGKDTVGAILRELAAFRTIAFADAVKRTAADLFGLSYDALYGSQKAKETPDPRWPTPEHPEGLTPRYILQRLGTEVGRAIHPDVWVRATFAKIDSVNEEQARYTFERGAGPTPPPGWAITDVRFPSEAAAIRARGGWVVRVSRLAQTRAEEADTSGVLDHASEREVERIAPDALIRNDGSLDDLAAETLRVLNWIRSSEAHRAEQARREAEKQRREAAK